MDVPSGFEVYKAPFDVHDGPPCVLHEPSIVLRATIQLGNLPASKNDDSQGECPLLD
jgi:hypothetical protein